MTKEKIPKYYLIKNKLAEKIEQEEWKSDVPIPSERELINSYNVSRITIRRAISELVNEGYLYTIQGKGTFVKEDGYAQDLFSIASCTEDILKFGMTPSRKVIYSGVTNVDKKRMKALSLTENELMFELERVYLADNEPINVTKTYLPYKYIPGIEKYDFTKCSLYEILEKEYHIKITKAIRSVEAVLVDENISKLLNVNMGVPILLFMATTYGEINGVVHPIETFKCHYRSDKFKFYINQVK